ncbi:MAG: hypothetical protein AVDCRST_MAG64-3410 [uncultured Phycisphaerae bacterium]|uniref:Uncharacterized protein n=1 Tax=uncultured Phycisphaerae bacterium TaxID=904963 RepID=A0A6J4PZG1_9BACT|nr:MAG: hypothetical protein AVDCRST_MAG64-3410 [uncultured Phycisphaerae bacterium]
MGEPTGEQLDADAGDGGVRPVGTAPPAVLEYARPRTAGPRDVPTVDFIDVFAGCVVVAVAMVSAVGAVGLFAVAVARLWSTDADPFGPAFMFCGSLVLAAVAVTCGRAALPGHARQQQS